MANRKKRLAREQARLQKDLKFKEQLRAQKKLEAKGIVGIFEQMKQVKFRWDLLPKNIKKKHDFPIEMGAKALRELFQSKRKFRKIQERLELIIRHPKLVNVSMNFPAALVYFLKNQDEFVRPFEEWKPPKSNHDVAIFESLFRHLFVKYPLPKFVTRMITPLNMVHIHSPLTNIISTLVSGAGVHKSGFDKVKLNGKMNYLFQTAPARLSMSEAIWWAKIRGLGASEKVAYCIIGRIEPNQWDVWQDWVESFVFFTKKLNLTDSKLLKEIFKFVMYQNSYQNYYVEIDGNSLRVPAIYPDYSLKGRSLASVQRHLEEWKKQIEWVKAIKSLGEFPKPPFKNFEYETNSNRYQIRYLKNYKELAEEGRKMKHCVASYADNCLMKESSIWSLRRITGKGVFKRLATVEIGLNDGKYELDEFQAKCNQKPTDFAINLVKQWATEEGIDAKDWSYC